MTKDSLELTVFLIVISGIAIAGLVFALRILSKHDDRLSGLESKTPEIRTAKEMAEFLMNKINPPKYNVLDAVHISTGYKEGLVYYVTQCKFMITHWCYEVQAHIEAAYPEKGATYVAWVPESVITPIKTGFYTFTYDKETGQPKEISRPVTPLVVPSKKSTKKVVKKVVRKKPIKPKK